MARFKPHIARRRAAEAAPSAKASPIARWVVAFGTAFCLAILLSVHFLPDRVSLRLGEQSPSLIKAPRGVTYIDTDATIRSKQAAAAAIPSVYEPDPGAAAQASHAVSELFAEARTMRSERPAGLNKKIDRLSGKLGAIFTRDQLRHMLLTPPSTLDRLENLAHRMVREQMDRGIRSDTDDINHAKRDFERSARQSVAMPEEAKILEVAAMQAVRPNLILNRQKTDAAREAAARSAAPVMGQVRVGETIIREGEVFTQSHLDKCTALGLITPRMDLETAVSLFALAAGMVLVVGLYVKRYDTETYDDINRLVLLAGLCIFSVLGIKLFSHLLGIQLSYAQFGYLAVMTVVAAGMIVSELLNPSLAVVVAALLAVQTGLIMNHEIRFAVMAVISALVGIHTVADIRDRSSIVRAFAVIAATNVALVWVLAGVLGDSLAEATTGTAWAISAAGFAIFLFWFHVTLLEKPFGILTHLWMLELSSSDKPMLRQLTTLAPGTYAHSIMVGNLAEAAADAVGADGLFCRVASYYHDVGKIKRPHCFIENQHSRNIHDRLHPDLSARVIAAHVTDGLELAKEYGLPARIRDIIAEHHGTSLIRYFYYQALTESEARGTAPVSQELFRYSGPRPRTRESGIIMLADSVEAAARALEKPTEPRLRDLIDRQFEEKLSDGQLEECELTFKDIERIRESFVRVLGGMLHARIDYPEFVAAVATSGTGGPHAGNGDGLASEEAEHPADLQGGPERAGAGGGRAGRGLDRPDRR